MSIWFIERGGSLLSLYNNILMRGFLKSRLISIRFLKGQSHLQLIFPLLYTFHKNPNLLTYVIGEL